MSRVGHYLPYKPKADISATYTKLKYAKKATYTATYDTFKTAKKAVNYPEKPDSHIQQEKARNTCISFKMRVCYLCQGGEVCLKTP